MKLVMLYVAGFLRIYGCFMENGHMIKVSVIIPVYNAEQYLQQCLDSLCMQTLQDIEIICVDDGSTDDSLAILEEYRKRDSRVKVFHQKNQYAGVARNVGMCHAIGKYLSFLDADDFFEENFLEKMYIAAEMNSSDIVICRVNYFDDNSQKITPRNVEEELNYLPENTNSFSRRDIPNHLFQITNGWAWDKLFRTDFIGELGIQFQPYRIANDGFFVYAALAQADKITKIDDFLVYQRINNGQSLSNTREKTWHCGFDMLYAIRDYLQENKLYDIVQQSFLNFSMKYVVWSFEGMRSWKIKTHIYDAIREELVPALKMEGLEEDYFYNKDCYSRYSYIITHTYDEYVSSLFEEKQRVIHDLNRKLIHMTQRADKKIWLFPYSLVEKGSRIVLYGAGEVGKDYYKQVCDSEYCKIILWMDKRFAEEDVEEEICGWTQALASCSYDKIVIAVRGERAIQEILAFLIEQDVPAEKIVFVI